MVLFNLRFPISSTFSRSEFVSAITSFLPSLLDVDSELLRNRSDDGGYAYNSEDGAKHFVCFEDDNVAAFQMVRRMDTGVYTASFVRSDGENMSMVGVRVERQTNSPDVDDSKTVDMFASVIKDIFLMGAGEDDHGIPCRGRAVYVDRTSMDLVKRILTGSENFYNPVVYVPFSSQPEGICKGEAVNCDKLARDLFGMAHVVAEDNKFAAAAFQNEFGSQYPNTVMMLMPTGHRHCVAKDSKSPYSDTVKYIKMSSDEAIVDESLSFQKLYLKHRLSEAGVGAEAEAFYGELISEQEAVLAAKDAEIEDLKAKLAKVQSKSDALSHHLQEKQVVSDRPSLTLFTKSDDMFFEGERMNVLLKLIKKEYDSMSGDSYLMSSRKYRLLGELLECNSVDDASEQAFRDDLADVLKDGVLTQEARRKLERMSFTVSKSKNNHWKVAYMGDATYSFTLGSSPSDYRSGENAKSDIISKMFGC